MALTRKLDAASAAPVAEPAGATEDAPTCLPVARMIQNSGGAAHANSFGVSYSSQCQHRGYRLHTAAWKPPVREFAQAVGIKNDLLFYCQ